MEKFIQIIGAIAVIFWIISVQFKEKKKIVFFQLVANFFYCVQYFILKAPSAALMNMTSVFRSLVLYQFDKHKYKKKPIVVLIGFICAVILIGIFYIKKPIDVIPLVITLAYTLSTWQDNKKILVWTFLIAAIIWIYYNISVGAYSALVGNGFEIASAVISLYKIKTNKKKPR